MGSTRSRATAIAGCEDADESLNSGDALAEPRTSARRIRTVKLVIVMLCAGLIAIPVALGKGGVDLAVSDSTPKVGQTFAVDVHTSWVVPSDDWLRLIAVAPGEDWFQVAGTVTGAASRTHARIPQDGFNVRMKRVAPKHWRALIRLPRPGRWRIVLPNGTHDGFITPPPAEWMPWVRAHR
jgi:hypothetical protein